MNDTSTAPAISAAETLPALLSDSARRYADRPAMEFQARVWTYAALDALVDRAARGLQTLGVGPGVRVGLCLPNTPYMIIYYYAVLRAGATVVNFNPLYVERELAHQITDSGTTLMITVDVPMIAAKLRAVSAATGLRHIVVCPIAGILPPLKALLYRLLRRRDIAPAPRDELHLRHADIMADTKPPAPVSIDATSVAVLQYTGGTTGTPKGAMLTHAALLANARQVAAHNSTMRLGQERTLAVLPLFHVFAMSALMNTSILIGAALILQPRFVLEDLLRVIERRRPTIFGGVPTLYAAINNACATRPRDLRSLTLCVSGGAPLPAEVRDRFTELTGCRVLEGYGLTESAGVVCCQPAAGVIKDGSIGTPVPGTVVEIRDPVAPHALLPPGERGELCVRGPQLMAGYWQQPQATADSFIDGALRTGDIGRVDADGYVFIVDRLKELILCSGYNVYPSVIEAALYRHPAVAEAAVVAVPDSYRGQAPLAFVALHPGAAATPADLQAHLAEHISKIEMPRAIEIRESLPKTPIGKLSKKELLAELAR
jgi:long-chain acyl-CoA synthetase